MSKRINQQFENGRVNTFTTGNPRGSLPNFDVSISSPANGQHRPTELSFDFEQGGRRRKFTLNGRNSRTLYEVLSRHFSEVG
jgi:hypothetical protein